MQKRVLITLVLMVLSLNPQIFGDIGQGYSPIKPLSTISSVTVLSPNGGENFYIGSTTNITWQFSNVVNVKIELTTNSGNSWVTINPNVSASSGSYEWIVDFPSNFCKIRISDVNSPTIYDESDGYFSILYPFPAVPNLISPLHTSTMNPISTTLEWSFAAWAHEYNVQISTDNNFNTTLVDTTLLPHSSNQTYQCWNLTHQTQYFWRVRSKNSTGFSDWSGIWNFTTTKQATINLLSPNGGEAWAVGTTKNITWTSSNLDSIRIEFSSNNGGDWSIIANTTSALSGTYQWTVPDVVSTNCKVRLTGVDAIVSDISDNTFTIITHRPEINFAELPNYQNEVVYPTSGSDETLFEYIIKYSSGENKPPYPGFPKIVLDFNGNGNITEPGEGEFTMTPVDLTDTTYSDGKLYSYLTMLPLGGNHKVKFIGADADGDTAVVNQALLQYRSVPLVLGGLPDAVVEAADIVFSNENPNPSQPFTMTTKVYNRSDQNMENVKVKFYKDNTVIGEQNIPYLSHRTETTVSLQTVINESGFYAMQVRVDPDNTIPEKNEFNNIALRPLLIGNAPITGNISVTALPTYAYAYTQSYLRGSAKYVGVFGGDQKVQGGRVKVTLHGGVYYGTTNSNGDFKLLLPCLPAGNYNASIEVTDTRLTGSTTSEVIVEVLAGKDIAITSMVLSNYKPKIGEQITAHILARNTGTEPLSNVLIHLYNGYQLKDTYIISSLAVGAEIPITLNTSFTQTGLYYVRAIADPFYQMDEINKKNNAMYQEAIVLADKPDLVVTNIEVLGKLKINSTVTISATIKNIGGIAVNNAFLNSIEIGGVQIGQHNITGIGAGGEYTFTLSHQLTTVGLQMIKVHADYTNVILEGDETNNVGAIFINVLPQLPNLTFVTGSLINVPLNPGVAQPVQLYVTAKNTGDIPSLQSQIRFSVEGVNYNSISNVPALAVNEEVVINANTTWTPGFEATFISKAEIDFDNQVTENNELDNGMTKAIVVGYGSDLALDSTSHIKASNTYAHTGETVQLSALVNNHGTIFSTGNVEFYYINNNSQRIYINSAIVSVPANDTASSSSVSFTLPFAPINIFAKLVNSQPADYNLSNNEQTLLIGDRAPQIIGLDTLIFAEDSSLIVNLNDFVQDLGDQPSTLVWEFTPAANIFTNYQQNTQTLTLTGTPEYFGTENIIAKVTDPHGKYDTKSVMVIVTQVIDYPGIPQLVLPISNSIGLIQPIQVKWRSSTYSEEYQLQIASDSLFNNIVHNDSLVIDTFKIVTNLQNYQKYFWRVRGINFEASGNWSEVWNFKTLGSAYAVELVSPINQTTNQPINGLTFNWKKPEERIETIFKYQYQLSTDSLFGSLVVNDTTLTDTVKTLNGLNYLTKYYWRVRASNETGWGDWSTVGNTTTIIEKPSSPILALPLNNASKLLQPITLKWNKTPRAEKYRLEVSEFSNFSILFLVDTTLTDTLKLLPQLENPKTYYWRVRGSNIGGIGDFSTVWNFRTLGFPLVVEQLFPSHNSINQPINNLQFVWKRGGEQTMALNAKPIKGGISDVRNSISEDQAEEFTPQIQKSGVAKSGNNGILSGSPESILSYWLEVTSDTASAAYILRDSTITDTVKIISGFNYYTNYYWRLKARNENGWGAFTSWFKFRTIIERPVKPNLAAPTNNSIGHISPITLSWYSSLRAESYTLQISKNADFSNLVYNDSSIVDTSKNVNQLDIHTTHYWRVFAKNIGGKSDTSSVWNFKTLGTATIVNLVYPQADENNVPINLNFTWKKSSNLENSMTYWFELTLDTTGAVAIRDTAITDTVKSVQNLQNNKFYYWRMKAKNVIGWGQFSDWRRFKTIVPIPSITLLSRPLNNAVALPTNPQLIWRKAEYGDVYQLQVSKEPSFGNMTFNDSTLTDTSKTLDSLEYKTKYYWRVRSHNIAGWGAFSLIRTFTTKFKPIIAPTALSATATIPGKVNLLWIDNSDNETGFVILRKAGDSTSGNSLISIDTVAANLSAFIDSTVADSSKFSYKVYAINIDTLSAQSNYATVTTLTSIREIFAGLVPKEYQMEQNYPNPFNPTTTIRYGLPFESEVKIEIYDISGQRVTSLVDETQKAGYYEVWFKIDGLSSGIYFYIISAKEISGSGNFRSVKKMILMK